MTANNFKVLISYPCLKKKNFTGKLDVQNVCLLQSLLDIRQRNDVGILGLFPPLRCMVVGHRQYDAHKVQ